MVAVAWGCGASALPLLADPDAAARRLAGRVSPIRDLGIGDTNGVLVFLASMFAIAE